MKLPTVDPAPISPDYVKVNVTPDSFGAPVAKGLLIASETVAERAKEMIAEADRQEAFRITSTATDMFNERMSDYTNRMLSDAKGSTDGARAEFDKIINEAVKEAKNPRQKLVVQETLTQKSVAHLGTVRMHEAQQFKADTVAQAKALLASSIDSVKIDAMNEGTAWLAKHNAAVAGANLVPGADAATLARVKAESVSSVTASQLQSLLAKGKTVEFITLYPQVKHELYGNDVDQFAKYATETVDLVVEQKLTLDFYTANKDNMNAALEAARSVLEGKQESNVIAGLTAMFSQVEAGKKQLQGQDIDAAKAAFVQGGWKVSAIPRDVYSRVLSTNAEVLIQMTQLEQQHAAGTRASIKTDPVTWTRWQYLTDDEKIQPENDPANWAGLWNEADYQAAVQKKAAILQTEGGFTAASQKPMWTQDQLTTLIKGEFSKVYKDTTTDANARRFKALNENVTNALNNYRALNEGKMPTYEMLQREVAYQMVEGQRIQGGLWTSTKRGRRFEALAKGEEFSPYKVENGDLVDPLNVVDVVPSKDAADIARALRAKGKAVTADEILRVYRAGTGK